jgi:copper chaperone CopZ
MTIRKALNENGFDKVEIDLLTKTVEVDLKDRTKEQVIEIIESKGYDVAQ